MKNNEAEVVILPTEQYVKLMDIGKTAGENSEKQDGEEDNHIADILFSRPRLLAAG